MRAALLTLVAACSTAASPRTAAPPVPAGPSMDDLVRRAWAEASVTPAPPVDDGAFLRRVTLDLTGRLPSRQEAAAYLGDPSPTKKVRLVDGLLASPAYAEHWADVYVALFGGRTLRPPYIRGVIRSWLVAAFAKNEGWDRMVAEMLTASGKLSENGALGFLVAHGARGGSPEAVAGATSRVFLGLQAQCAQCHDHPYDPRFKQEDFYGLVAFFARTRARPVREQMTVEVFDRRFGQARMPVHKTGEEVVVGPKFLGRAVPDADAVGRRAVLAREVVGSPLFAKAAVNHMWALLFGRGIVQPWDDLGGETEEHPALLTALAERFRASGYDRRALLRAIALSEAYARASAGGEGDKAEELFARAVVRPLPPEVLFRALLDATGADDVAARRVGREVVERRVEQGLRQFMFIFGDDEMAEVDRATGNVPQALVLFNGELLANGSRAAPGGQLRAILGETADPGARVERLYLQAYARSPSERERERALALVRGGGPAAYEDLFYALLTATEFTTNH